MRIVDQGIVNHGVADSPRAVSSFPTILPLTNGSILASYRVGASKDDAGGNVELRFSDDLGATWTEPRTPFESTINGTRGSIGIASFTNNGSEHLLGAIMWVDREAYPGKPLFNEATQGCLPMRIFTTESFDQGATLQPLRAVKVPEDLGPPSLTNPILCLPSGRLALSLESNKHYLDTSPWMQKVTYLFSDDNGKTWGNARVVSQDPTGRIFNWDQRAGVTRDGAIATFAWTYDSTAKKYLNIHRRISRDEGETWTEPEDLGFSDQAATPAIFPDGRIVLPWVDRYGTHSIRARVAEGADGEFARESEVVLWDQSAQRRGAIDKTGALLTDMGVWNYGLPCATALPNGEAMVVFYAGDGPVMDIHWVRLSLD